MSELQSANIQLRVEAIKALLRNHPSILAQLLVEDESGINLNSTPDSMDLYNQEDILVRVAWDIWNGAGETEFHAVLHDLSMEDFDAFLEAMAKFKILRLKIHHLYASGAEDD
ncbi:MAG: hypothetical protein OEZ55_05830 [Nitrospinota bacterium]|nr:hypothetical protein [Nitrospinota bacterium]MDH5756169.1 hypothetical protein [Nitrospinota bacterium]